MICQEIKYYNRTYLFNTWPVSPQTNLQQEFKKIIQTEIRINDSHVLLIVTNGSRQFNIQSMPQCADDHDSKV